ncbi:Testis-specific serine kinase substrate [Madurella mycetomatis]|uniref:Testis-specific serine kinase substrate n=1 Tax=Madurella mycetomatis TaxID=100816 RepID=A0A175W0S9_9PEZI|nr:Testis-specific serine kinase substrate [Madurella mycetomatis]
MSAWKQQPRPLPSDRLLLSTPIFLGHGIDDAFVPAELSREARHVLARVGFQLEWREYSGTEVEGHWLKAPEESAEPDQLHKSLSTAWASFLGAQQCSHEISALRRTLDEHIQATNLSVTSLQRDTARQHEFAAAIAESRSRIEQHTLDLKWMVTLRDSLSALQQETSRDREHTSKKIIQLSEKVVAQGASLEGMRSTMSQGVGNTQEQCRSVLKKVEFLQGELRELRAEKAVAEQRLAALECQITTMAQARQDQLSEETAKFLDQMLSRHEALAKLHDEHDCGIPTQTAVPARKYFPAQMDMALSGTMQEHSPARHEECSAGGGTQDTQPTAKAKRKMEESPAAHAKRPMSLDGRDIRTLYLSFCDRYKKRPQKCDVDFIWEFIGCIESPAMSRHIQESLVVLLPDYVMRNRYTRRKNPQRHINISKSLTWRKFREALVKVLPPA